MPAKDVIDEFLKAIPTILQLIVKNDVGGVLTFVGLVLIVAGCVASYFYMSTPPAEIGPGRKAVTILLLVAGFIFSAAGPSLSIWTGKHAQTPGPVLMSKETAFENLRLNTRVETLVRFIVWSGTQSELSIDRLTHLGRRDQRYTFVGDYDEVQGQLVAAAAKNHGLQVRYGDHISVVIFPRRDKSIYPANAKGILQIVDTIEGAGSVPDRFDARQRLGENLAPSTLGRTDVPSYSWPEVSRDYPQQCAVAREFRCAKVKTGRTFPAASLMGGLTPDWHPIGFSRKWPPPPDPCLSPTPNECNISNWDEARTSLLQEFGARAFLTDNAELSSLTGRMVFDYDQPGKQRLPILVD